MRVGVLTPHSAIGPEAEFAQIAPGRIVTTLARVASDGQDGSPASPAGLRALTAEPLLDRAAETLVAGAVDAIAYASTTSAYVIGFAAETAMASRLSALTNVPVVSTCASAVRALRLLEAERVALIGAPWFDPELNAYGTAYFRSQGFHVVSSASAELAQEPDRIEPSAVYEWTARHVGDDAEAVFIGGNGFRAAGAIERLEATLGRPVLTSNQVLLWDVVAQAGDPFTVDGYGRLWAHGPRRDTSMFRRAAGS